MIVKFITLKWGSKYGPEYVNRLYTNLKNVYSGEFEFHCFTDDPNDINLEIKIHDINTLPHFKENVFTAVKIDLFKHLPFEGPYAFLDLDVIVLRDLKEYFDEYKFTEPRYIYNDWVDDSRKYLTYHIGDCFVNSSFLTWDKNQFEWLYDLFEKNKNIINLKFQSFDKFVYYCAMNHLKFHPEKTVYAYSFGANHKNDSEKYKYRAEYYLAIFNTSHNQGIELHDANGWARDIWINGRLTGEPS